MGTLVNKTSKIKLISLMYTVVFDFEMHSSLITCFLYPFGFNEFGMNSESKYTPSVAKYMPQSTTTHMPIQNFDHSYCSGPVKDLRPNYLGPITKPTQILRLAFTRNTPPPYEWVHGATETSSNEL